MSFGQQSGPPASAKQVAYLTSLLAKAGYASIREARGPLGLTQRQGNGKFTTQEASALIEQLLAEDEGYTGEDEPADATRAGATGTWGSGRRAATPAAGRAAAERSTAASGSAVTPASQRAAEQRRLRAEARQLAEREAAVAGIPADILVQELERRGWTCTPPPT